MVKAIDFGFIFSRFCRFYGERRHDVLAMPIQTFWMMHKNIDRVMAEADLRLLSVYAYAQSGEGIEKFSEDMRQQMGQVVEMDAVKTAFSERCDKEGLEGLRDLGRMM